jgi:putative lipoprotein
MDMLRLRFIVTVSIIAATLAAPAVFGQSSSSGSTITGTISYMARMALPANAAIDVRLEDVTLADAPAKLVAENIFSLGGNQVPVPFQLPYNPAEIQPAHRYTVRANITVDGDLLFTTSDMYPVLTHGGGNEVALNLQAVRQGPLQPTVAPNAFRGTRWMLTELHGKPVTPVANNPAYIVFDPDQKRYSGSSGCNRIVGTFQLDGNSLQLMGGAMTTMACPEPLMKQEKEFNEALTATGSYEVTGNTLELLARKKVVAKFTAGQ